MATEIVYASDLTRADVLVLQNLEGDIKNHTAAKPRAKTSKKSTSSSSSSKTESKHNDEATVAALEGLTDPNSTHFVPTVFTSFDLEESKVPAVLRRWLLDPYVRAARGIVRIETDVVMLNHLILYFCTSVPSALFLFYRFTWIHAILHFVMQLSYVGTYTLMMHQHIHGRGILNHRFALIDSIFPYITDPLMGHTWNSYFYHHVKHHHAEGNGPNDLSSTLRYERDNPLHFAHYVARFYFLIWFDLPLYFLRNGRVGFAAKAAFWELASYANLYLMYQLNARAAFFVFILPVMLLRVGLMVGNWGQHAFVDKDEPDSDYRSSITLIDVPSNRHCFNDGYHTSHHLNPLRHWRDHPAAFIKGKEQYAAQHALVFHDIDYIMITVRLFMRDYKTLARCMVPMGDQIAMSLEERMAHLKTLTRPFTEQELRQKFKMKQ